jgi:hypothetical protein
MVMHYVKGIIFKSHVLVLIEAFSVNNCAQK